MPNSAIAVASDVCTRIYYAGAFEFSDETRGWYDQASSMISLIAGDHDIRYIDHSINTTNDPKAVILAITDDVVIVIDVEYSPVTEVGSLVSARVIGRVALDAVSVERVTNAIKWKREEWPVQLKVTVTYGDDKFSLPFRSTDPSKVAELAALVPSLARDLNA